MRYLIIFLMLCGCCFGQVDYNDSIASFTKFDNYYTLLSGYTAQTISVWVERDGPLTASLFDIVFFPYNSVSFAIRVFPSGVFVLYGNDGSGVKSLLSEYFCDSNTLYNVVGVNNYAEDYQEIYIDGILVASNYLVGFSATQTTYTGGGPKGGIGGQSDAPARRWPGTITDARVYNRVLTLQEIKIISNENTAYELAHDPYLVLRTNINTNDTGDILVGVAKNYGTGTDGIYISNPIVSSRKIRIRKPMGMELP